jgi:hypothetical protein
LPLHWFVIVAANMTLYYHTRPPCDKQDFRYGDHHIFGTSAGLMCIDEQGHATASQSDNGLE